jgi:hypothetical protein
LIIEKLRAKQGKVLLKLALIDYVAHCSAGKNQLEGKS